jgi:hypothetical protein
MGEQERREEAVRKASRNKTISACIHLEQHLQSFVEDLEQALDALDDNQVASALEKLQRGLRDNLGLETASDVVGRLPYATESLEIWETLLSEVGRYEATTLLNSAKKEKDRLEREVEIVSDRAQLAQCLRLFTEDLSQRDQTTSRALDGLRKNLEKKGFRDPSREMEKLGFGKAPYTTDKTALLASARKKHRRLARDGLLRSYLYPRNPGKCEKCLHPTRTLEQYYYYALPDTQKRDRGQVIYCHQKEKREENGVGPTDQEMEEFQICMVDQLWLWVGDDST